MSLKILVCDDDPGTLRVIVRLLRREGHSVDPFTNPAEALERLHGEPYDVLLTDQFMPEMSGVELVQRALDVTGGMRCIIVSGGNPGPGGERVTWLAKPFDLDSLLSVVHAA